MLDNDVTSEVQFANGDAVIGYDGDVAYEGVVSEIIDDVVIISYFDTETRSMEEMDFHVSCIENLKLVSSGWDGDVNPLGGLPDEQQAGYIG